MVQQSLLKQTFHHEDLLSNMMDNIQLGIYMFDANGHSLYANSHFQLMFGYDVDELKYVRSYDLFRLEDLQFLLAKLYSNDKNDSNQKYQLQGKRKDNRKIDLQLLSLKKDDQSNILIKLLEVTGTEKNGIEFFKVFQELENLKYALDQSATVSITDKYGDILYVNDKFCEISKYDRKELIGKNHRIVKSGYHPKEVYQNMWKTIAKGGIWKGEVCNRAKDGSIWWGDATIVPFLDEQGIPYQYIGIRSDITEKKKAEQKIYEMAYYDFLTKLPNRRKFESHIHDILEDSKRKNASFALMILDLHGIKFVNDSLGTKMGDRLLQEVGESLLQIIYQKGKLYRIDGDEFAIILPHMEKFEMKDIATQVLSLFEQPFSIDKFELFLTVNIGISLYPESGDQVKSIMRNTYFALQQSRTKGRNTYEIFSSNMNDFSYKGLVLRNDLQKALKEHEFFVNYQPRIETKSNRIIGAEALVRWKHKTFGPVSPMEFIPLAEEEGLIVSIGEEVLRQACQQNKKWQEAGLPPIVVSVNFSVIQFLQSDMVQTVMNILDECGLEPKWLEIELTESAFIKDKSVVSSKIDQLKEYGITTAIDDFGTGYASLSHLKNLEAKTLKIDKSFIDGIPNELISSEIVSALTQLGRKFHIKTVAEGVETIEQLNALKEFNCDEIQGYLYSKPVDSTEFEELLKQKICLPKG